MKLDDMLLELYNLADKEQADKMAVYMQNHFSFLGIPRPLLKKVINPYLSQTRKEEFDWEIVFTLWDVDFREAQYIALDYLKIHEKKIQVADLEKLSRLIITKSWWETVDTIDEFVGGLVLKDSSLRNVVLEWSKADNIWLRRVSIDYQQKFKEKTDTEALTLAICNNLGSKEFFINKAIGWSLREYSKTNSDWVRDFVNTYKDKMDKLSVKEASKYL